VALKMAKRKQTKSRAELEAIVLAELRETLNCGDISSVVVVGSKHDGFTLEVGSYIADRSPFLAKDLKTGKFFNDRAEYDAANHDWLKHRDAAAYENDLAMLREMGRGFNEP